jgi:signal transduction histidine kinase
MLSSLRARLTLWYSGVLLLSLMLFALLLYAVFARQLHRHHDAELATDAARVNSFLNSVEGSVNVVRALDKLDDAPPLLMVRDDKGTMLYRSVMLQDHEASLGQHDALVHAAMRGDPTAQFFTTAVPPFGTVRFICLPAAGNPRLFLQIGEPIGDVDETLRFFGTAVLILIPVVLALMSGGGFVLARRALSPMTRIQAALEAIQAEDLSRRIDIHPREAELGALVQSINRLLDRLARAFASLREFAADASHQLQTPLTVMRGSVDVVLSSPRDAASYRGTLEEIGQEADAMTAILNDLRALSLADAPVLPHGGAVVDLSALVAEASDVIVALGESTGVIVTTRIAAGVCVRGDRVRLQQVVFNLGENAVKYSRSGDHVGISLQTEAGQAILVVTDTGIGIGLEDLPHIFERFYRARGAGERAGGSGLGLAIARRIVEAHRGDISAQSSPGAGARFVVTLPLAQLLRS